jgi:hypothetical protein
LGESVFELFGGFLVGAAGVFEGAAEEIPFMFSEGLHDGVIGAATAASEESREEQPREKRGR